MTRIVFRLERDVKLRLRRLHRRTKDKAFAQRCQLVLLISQGLTRPAVALAVGLSVSWVNRVFARFRDWGIAGLHDGREDNGNLKVDEWFCSSLYKVLANDSPQSYGYRRPTWTQELLVRVMVLHTGVFVSVGTMSRALKRIGARLGRPRPVVGCPWEKGRKQRRLEQIQTMLSSLPPDQVAVYLDEVDVHLNPKIGCDWMNEGQQKDVMTPGQNKKRYLCGALDAGNRLLAWVKGEKKNSLLFIRMLRKLATETYAGASVIHVVLDNYRVHTSKASRSAIEALGGRVVLHFLPPYCPQHNRIERIWLDLHANVTRNHTCASMEQLMKEVVSYLVSYNRDTRAELAKAA